MSKDNMVEEFGIGVGFLFENFSKLKQYTDKVNNQIKQSQAVLNRDKKKMVDDSLKYEYLKNKDHTEELSDISKKWLAEEEARRAKVQKRWDERRRLREKRVTEENRKRSKEEKDFFKMQDALSMDNLRNEKRRLKEEEQRRKDIQKRWNARAAERAKKLKAEIKLSEAVDNQVRIMQRSASYRDLSRKGASGQVDKEVERIRNTVPLREQVNEIKNLNAGLRDATRQMRAMHVVQTGLTDSARNMVRSYVSMFAILESTVAIKNVGMEFEGMEVGMSAVAGSAERAGKEIAFLRKEADRLGFDLTKTAKSYVKLFAAAEGKASQEDIRSGFVSLMEASTVFQLTGDDTNRTIKAIMQMFSKSAIQAEELKQQLGDVLPIAMRALEKSTGKTAKELFKMMEMGQLGADRIMPFLDAIGGIANEGNAVAKAIESVRVQENRLINQSKEAGNKIFKSGFGEGLAELYKTLSNILKDAGPQLEKIGKVFGYLFKGIAHLATVVEGPLKFVIDNIELLTSAYILKRLALLGTAFRTAFLPITAAYVALEEIAALMSDKLVGGIEKSLGYQVNITEGTKTAFKRNEKGGLVSSGKAEKAFSPMGLSDMVYGPLAPFVKMFQSSDFVQSGATSMMSDLQGRVSRTAGNKVPVVNVGGIHINGDGLDAKEVASVVDSKLQQSYALAIGR